MDNQQLYYTYVSFEDKGRYYVGFTKHAIATGYKGSYSDKTFKPYKRLDLYETTSKYTAMLMECMYQSIWNVAKNPSFANKARMSLTQTSGFCDRHFSAEERLRISKKLTGRKRPEHEKAKISKAHKGKKLSPSHIANLRKPKSKAAREALSKARMGMKFSETHKARLGLRNKINGKKTRIKNILKKLFVNALDDPKEAINEVQRLERLLVELNSQLETPDN